MRCERILWTYVIEYQFNKSDKIEESSMHIPQLYVYGIIWERGNRKILHAESNTKIKFRIEIEKFDLPVWDFMTENKK